jgi:hypothetical protein
MKITSVIAAAGALLALPGAALGATPFGSPLTENPSGGGNPNVTQCGTPPQASPCTRVLVALNSGADFPITAPMNGVVTKFRIKAASPDMVTFRLARLSEANGNTALGVGAGSGPTVKLGGTGQIEEFPARMNVQQGDHVALDAVETSAVFGSSGNTKMYEYAPPLADGQAPRGSTGNENEELLVQAVIEADADGDGFGDETQDGCPGSRRATGECPVPDRKKPRITRLKLTPNLFVTGSRIRYRLSENAKVTFKVKRCARPVGTRCAQWKALPGKLVQKGKAGRNSMRLRKLRGQRLSPSRYKLVAVAVDAAGNRSAKKAKRFRVVL